ncbi:MAG: hypothetical protein H7Y02_13535 [Candidatus Obscuribacterales bacterium]|nr:hypothetical protein [Steroidobacteraceae bacterium]
MRELHRTTWREGERVEETLHRTDSALYVGKHAGRDRVIVDEVTLAS